MTTLKRHYCLAKLFFSASALIGVTVFTATASFCAEPATNALGNGLDKDSPTYIKSEKLKLNSTTRTFLYEGDVELINGDMTMYSQILEGSYSEDQRIQKMVAKKDVLIIKGPTIRATSERADYVEASGTMVLTENPEIQETGSVLSADKVIIYLNENRSEAQGQVRVKIVEAGNAESSSKSNNKLF